MIGFQLSVVSHQLRGFRLTGEIRRNTQTKTPSCN